MKIQYIIGPKRCFTKIIKHFHRNSFAKIKKGVYTEWRNTVCTTIIHTSKWPTVFENAPKYEYTDFSKNYNFWFKQGQFILLLLLENIFWVRKGNLHLNNQYKYPINTKLYFKPLVFLLFFVKCRLRYTFVCALWN